MADFSLHRGNTVQESQTNIDSTLAAVISQATNQAADGCLKNEATVDKTTKLTEANTVLSQDTSVLTESGNAKAASQTDHYQHLLINSRREANQLFEIALGKLSPENQTNAIRAMNLVEEQIFKATLNKRESTFIGSPEYLKNSVAEQNVSDAKKLLAAQINDGTFLRNLSAYANNGMQAQCVHQDADVVDYDHR